MSVMRIPYDVLAVTFDNRRYVEDYCRESGDTNHIHNFEKHEKNQVVIPGIEVAGPAVGLFSERVGPGFLLIGMSWEKQRRKVFFGETVIYKFRSFNLVKKIGAISLYKCVVVAVSVAEKDFNREICEYKMTALQNEEKIQNPS
jgi:hypothetical protein